MKPSQFVKHTIVVAVLSAGFAPVAVAAGMEGIDIDQNNSNNQYDVEFKLQPSWRN